jgi:hypothetical protein
MRRTASPVSCWRCSNRSYRCALRSAWAVSDATTCTNRTSSSENVGPSRNVRRKIAPIATPRHVIGTTVIDLTRRLMSSPLTCFRLGSLVASGMNTVSPLTIARFSSG